MKNYSAQLLIVMLTLVTILNACNVAKTSITSKDDQVLEREDGMHKAWLQELEKTADPHTGNIPVERMNTAIEYAKQIRKKEAHKTRSAVSGIQWTERGPNNVGGRTRSVIYDLNDTTFKTVWAGSVGGGLWKTNDITAASPSWIPINDFFANIAVSTIAQDPSNYNVIYFGTGEGMFNGDAIRGLGIWKTLDGGNTWNQLSSTNNSDFYFVQKIVVRDNGDVFTCTNNGVFKSINNGTTWTKVLGNGISGGSIDYAWDIEIAADQDLYASLESQVFKSDYAIHSGNTGNIGTWDNISPSGTYNRVELFTAPNNSTIVYAICNEADSVLQIMRSSDEGASWVAKTKPGFCDQGFASSDYTRGQAWYNLIGAADPFDANTIYIGGVDALKSSDGGDTWTQISSWSGGGAFDCIAPNIFVHADHHAIMFKPNSSNEILWGTDGGVYRTTDSGATFESKISSYNATQFYGCAIHPLQTNYFLAGAQDNGSHQFTSVGINSTNEITGGDGMLCHIDQTDGQIQITSYYNNYYNVSTDNGNTFNFIGGDGSGRFVNPTDFDDTNKIFYGAYLPGMYEVISDIGNSNSYDWKDISSVVDSTRTATAIKVDPNSPDVVWMGFRSLNLPAIFVRVDNASSSAPVATILSNGLPTDIPIYLSCIEVEKGNSDHLLVSYSNYGITSIFESINGGLNWHSVEGNLPDMPVRGIMLHPDSNDMAFIATELGVWSTTNLNGDSTEWTQTNSALANVSVDELQYRPSDHVIAAATHGRGLFTATIPHAPNLNFDALVVNTKETSEDTITCYSYKDYTINAMTSQLLTLPITANIIINAGASAISPLDFEYTTNGSFTLPSHQIVFSGSTNSIPVTIRVYDDRVYEPSAEMFTLLFDSISSNALPGIHSECDFTITDNDDNPLLVRAALWTEDFESGTNPPLLWNLEGVDVNQWGNQNFACGSTINNFTMQVYNTIANSCGYDNTATSLAVVSRMVDATASSSIQVAFDWISEGESGYDWGELVYSTDTLTPTWISVPGTPVFNSSNAITRSTFDLPTSLDGTKFLIAWLWTNDYAVGGLSMGIDNIEISGLLDRKIENTLATDNEYLGPNGISYYYNVDGDLICSIENLSSHDFGCTMVEIDRSGNGAQFLIGETDSLKKIFDKTFRVIPTNNAAVNLGITLYITNAELAGFETQGRTLIHDGKLFKTADSVSLATIYTPRDTATSLTQNVYLDGYALRGEFNTTLGGFGIGNPGSAKWSVAVSDFSKGEISIYPNPAGNACWIKTTESTNFKLINSVGQVIERFTVDGSKKINLNHLTSGLYIIQSETSNHYFKLIKQ